MKSVLFVFFLVSQAVFADDTRSFIKNETMLRDVPVGSQLVLQKPVVFSSGNTELCNTVERVKCCMVDLSLQFKILMSAKLQFIDSHSALTVEKVNLDDATSDVLLELRTHRGNLIGIKCLKGAIYGTKIYVPVYPLVYHFRKAFGQDETFKKAPFFLAPENSLELEGSGAESL